MAFLFPRSKLPSYSLRCAGFDLPACHLYPASDAYFQPVIEELLENPVPEGYVQYLRVKVRSIADKANPAEVQKSTFSDDR